MLQAEQGRRLEAWKLLPCPVCSYISTHIFTRGLLNVLMMEAVCTSETSVNFYETTWCNIAEDSHLNSRSHENLKSYLAKKRTQRKYAVGARRYFIVL
jgi:hypothetical protein